MTLMVEFAITLYIHAKWAEIFGKLFGPYKVFSLVKQQVKVYLQAGSQEILELNETLEKLAPYNYEKASLSDWLSLTVLQLLT